jgi:hypothetical protein
MHRDWIGIPSVPKATAFGCRIVKVDLATNYLFRSVVSSDPWWRTCVAKPKECNPGYQV